MVNILSLSEISDIYRITMDTSSSPSITVHLDDDKCLVFSKCGSGLYYYDIDSGLDTTSKPKENATNYSFLTPVASNKEFFTKSEIEKADEARILQAQIGWPSKADFKNIVNKNLLVNYTITADDIARAEVISGPAVPILKGKMVRRRPEQHRNIVRVPLPPMIAEHHASDVLDVDFLCQWVCFFAH